MATHLDSVLKEHNRPDIYYVSGHEHSLEYFFNDSLHYLVSGAGSKVAQAHAEGVEPPAYLSSHPHNAARIAALQKIASAYQPEHPTPLLADDQWDKVKKLCR